MKKHFIIILLAILIFLLLPYPQYYYSPGAVCTTGIPAGCTDYPAEWKFGILASKIIISYISAYLLFFIFTWLKYRIRKS